MSAYCSSAPNTFHHLHWLFTQLQRHFFHSLLQLYLRRTYIASTITTSTVATTSTTFSNTVHYARADCSGRTGMLISDIISTSYGRKVCCMYVKTVQTVARKTQWQL